MRLIRRHNRGAYRQPREHIAADTSGTMALCGTDVAEVKGDRRGAFGRSDITSREAETIEGEYGICGRCRKAITPSAAPKMATADMKALMARAADAGERAFRDAIPTPMVVGTPRDMMASLTGGDDGGLDPEKPIYHVSEGICGSGGVLVRPGGSRFANYLKREGLGRADSYRGGVYVGCWQVCGERGSQSYARWCAAAAAMAEVMREAGIDARAETWID